MNKIRTFLYIAALLLLVISASAEEEFSQAIPVDSDQPVVSTVSLHSAGKLLITSGDDHVVRVWDLASGVQIKQLKGHTGWVRTSAFVPNTSHVLTAGDDGSVLIWDTARGTLLRKVAQVGYRISRLALSPDGRQVALVGFSRHITLLELESGDVLHQLDGRTDDIRALAFSQSGKAIATGGRDGFIRLWSVDSGQSLGAMVAHRQRVRDLVFLQGDALIVSVSDDRTMFVTDLENAAASYRIPLGGVVPFALAACGDVNEVAVGGTDNQISVWNLKRQSIRKVFKGHAGSITSLDYISRLNGLGGTLVSGSFDTSVRIWSLGPVEPMRVRVSEQSPTAAK